MNELNYVTRGECIKTISNFSNLTKNEHPPPPLHP